MKLALWDSPMRSMISPDDMGLSSMHSRSFEMFLSVTWESEVKASARQSMMNTMNSLQSCSALC